VAFLGHDLGEVGEAVALLERPGHPVVALEALGVAVEEGPVAGGEGARVVADYEAELETAYPRRAFGVLFPFTRTFAVARTPR
jgi:trans-aconitate 2-methyltransferase